MKDSFNLLDHSEGWKSICRKVGLNLLAKKNDDDTLIIRTINFLILELILGQSTNLQSINRLTQE